MTQFSEMTAKFSGYYQSKLKRLADPLRVTFGINYFFYLSISKSRECTFIGSNADLVGDFFDSKMHLCHPLFHPAADIDSGLYLYDSVQEQSFQQTMQALEERYNAKHSCLLTRKEPSRDIIYGFALPSAQKENEILLLNHSNLLNQFIRYFEDEMRCVLSRMDSCPVDLTPEAGLYKEIPLPKIKLDKTKLAQFLCQIDNLQLTSRDFDCIKHLIKGKTAAEISKLLHLSARTIEHRIERLKEKLHCETKSELVAYLQKIFPFFI
jgi:DNA-binding CsgD family transcriptional regulator